MRTMLESGDDCEVDPVKIQNNSIVQKQQRNLTMYCEMAWYKIVNSHCFFPRSVVALHKIYPLMNIVLKQKLKSTKEINTVKMQITS